jgi:hypothetical protein
MEYTYIPTGIKREIVRSGVDYHWKGQIVGTVGRGPVALSQSVPEVRLTIYSCQMTLYSCSSWLLC